MSSFTWLDREAGRREHPSPEEHPSLGRGPSLEDLVGPALVGVLDDQVSPPGAVVATGPGEMLPHGLQELKPTTPLGLTCR